MTGKYSIEYGKKYQINSYDVTLSLDSLRLLDNDSKRGHKRNKVLNKASSYAVFCSKKQLESQKPLIIRLLEIPNIGENLAKF